MRQRNCNAEVPSLDQMKAERKRLRYRRRYRRTLASTLTALLAAAAIGVLAATLWFPVLEIHGSSMSPTLRDGQIVVAVKSSRFSEGDVIAFYHGNKLLVKRCVAGPSDWVDLDESGNLVDPAKLEERPVTLGRSSSEYIEILDGLEEGEVVLALSPQGSSLMSAMGMG